MPLSQARVSVRRFVLSVAVLAASVAGMTATTSSQPAHAADQGPASTAIKFALAQLGKPYSWGADGPGSYDCSGLTSAAYRAAGITIPRTSRDQYRMHLHVRRSHWRPGDLLFWASDTSRPSTIHHVAMYLGGGWMVAAPHRGEVVQIQRVYTSGLMRYAERPAGFHKRGLLSLASGDTGTGVKAVQSRLRSNGYGLSVTGAFDRATMRAVRDFRAKHGLADHSYVDRSTWVSMVANGKQKSTP